MRALDLSGLKQLKAPDLAKLPSSYWVDLEKNELVQLKKFGVPKYLYEQMEKASLPVYAEHKGFTYLVLIVPGLGKGHEIARTHVHLIFTPTGLVSVGGAEYFESFRTTAREKELKSTSKEDALGYVVGEIVESFDRLNEGLEERTHAIEESIESAADVSLGELFEIRRALLALNKVFWHTREFLFDLRLEKVANLAPGESARKSLEMAANEVIYAIDMNATYREILTDALDVHHAVVANRINERIKSLTYVTVLLTVLATVVLIPNTVATIFGIPYFPITASSALDIGGMSFPAWELVLFVLVLSAIIPAFLTLNWWRGLRKKENL